MPDIKHQTQTVKIAILISGGGSNMKSIVHALEISELPIEVTTVIADRKASGLDFACRKNIPVFLCDKKANICNNKDAHFFDIDNILQSTSPDLIVLAGFLGILPRWLVSMWSGKIINIHPALLPKFGGKGMYGMKVHEAVIYSGETESGCTVHWVIPEVDKGDIIAQARVPVYHTDSPEQLQKRVLEQEHQLYARVVLDLGKQILRQ